MRLGVADGLRLCSGWKKLERQVFDTPANRLEWTELAFQQQQNRNIGFDGVRRFGGSVFLLLLAARMRGGNYLLRWYGVMIVPMLLMAAGIGLFVWSGWHRRYGADRFCRSSLASPPKNAI